MLSFHLRQPVVPPERLIFEAWAHLGYKLASIGILLHNNNNMVNITKWSDYFILWGVIAPREGLGNRDKLITDFVNVWLVLTADSTSKRRSSHTCRLVKLWLSHRPISYIWATKPTKQTKRLGKHIKQARSSLKQAKPKFGLKWFGLFGALTL